MRTTRIIAFLLVTQVLLLHAQSDPVALECSGKIPAEFLISSHAKYQEALRGISVEKRKGQEAQTLSRFELESNYNLDELLRSGRVLFNDEVSTYLAEVSRVLLQARPLTGGRDLRIYTLRSSAVNAFASSRGEVFITLGLLAQLENEAQLAYIIAHELAHVEQKHALKFYLVSDALERGKNRSMLKRASTDEKLLRITFFSKENENEADRLGLDRMIASPYRTTTLPQVFDVLKYSYLPFAYLPFERSLLESEHYRLPGAYWLEEVKPIEGEDENVDDLRSSHPNIKSRREAMIAVLSHITADQGRTDFVVSRKRFEDVRRLARNELPQLYLHAGEYGNAIYTAALLLRDNPESLSLKKLIAKSLYAYAKLRNSKGYFYETDHDMIEGESQRLHYLLGTIPAKEATILAWHFAWQLHRAHPNDKELAHITQDLCFEFALQYDDFDKFKNELPTARDEVQTALPADTAAVKRSKFDRIGAPAVLLEEESDYWHYAFAGQLNDASFVQYREEARKKSEQWKARKKYYESAEGKKDLKRIQKTGVGLNIPRVAIVNPLYLKLDARKKESLRYIDSEMGQEELLAAIKEASSRAGLKATLLDVSELRESDTETFNDIRHLNEWFAEQAQFFDLTPTPGNQQERIDSIARKYKTDYFLWTGVISLREKTAYKDLLYLPLVMLSTPVAVPLMIYDAVRPRYGMMHFSILYDVRTGRQQVIKFDTFEKRASGAMVKAHLYDTFSQIKRTR